MSLDTEKHFGCDMCDKKITVKEGYPSGWMIDVVIKAFIDGHACHRRSLSADFCAECSERVFPSWNSSWSDPPKGEFKRKWWQKFWFGSFSQTDSKEKVEG